MKYTKAYIKQSSIYFLFVKTLRTITMANLYSSLNAYIVASSWWMSLKFLGV